MAAYVYAAQGTLFEQTGRRIALIHEETTR